MHFTFNVSLDQDDQDEISLITFSRNWFTGSMKIEVDGNIIIEQSIMDVSAHFSFEATFQYKFRVGEDEQHKVLIEHQRPWLFGGLRPHKYTVYINGKYIHQYKGY